MHLRAGGSCEKEVARLKTDLLCIGKSTVCQAPGHVLFPMYGNISVRSRRQTSSERKGGKGPNSTKQMASLKMNNPLTQTRGIEVEPEIIVSKTGFCCIVEFLL